MKTIFKLTMKSATRDPFLLFWSILLPIGGLIALGLFVKAPQYPQRILTGMMATSVLFYALVTTAFVVLGQRRRGVYKLLRVTPLPLSQYVLSVAGAWTLISFICGFLVFAAGILVFSLRVSLFSVLMMVPLLLIATIGYVLLSFVVASVSRNEGHVSMISNLVMLPLLFCSDAFYSLAKAPAFLQTLSRFNPFQWFINGLRSTLALNWAQSLTSMGLLLAIVAVALLFAVRTFRFADA